MNYKIQITKLEPNTNYKEEFADFKEKSRYSNLSYESAFPQQEIIKNVLLVELTEEQYKAVKAAVMKTFE